MPQSAQHEIANDRYEQLAESFGLCRKQSLALCEGLTAEDHMIQGAPFASPPKWHLAHTNWFFATFILTPLGRHPSVHASWHTLFNSYYNGLGQPHARAERGILSRPALPDILAWREQVDEAVLLCLREGHFDQAQLDLLELGIQHEMQHQELLLTDLLFSFSRNPALPTYSPTADSAPASSVPLDWHRYDGGIVQIGADAKGFSFDNEHPRHRHFLEPFAIANRLVTNGDYQKFIAEDGYRDPQWWLSDGWETVRREQWQRPLHWLDGDRIFSLRGVQVLDPLAPVCHLSGYEADAYARWAGCRLPSEFEWEHAAQALAPPKQPSDRLMEVNQPGWFGSVWQWTQSAYGPYPGYRPDTGAVGEYNGKFMSSQWVLRGSSFATPHPQRRLSYRNFFYPADRWQFTGLRLAKSVATT